MCDKLHSVSEKLSRVALQHDLLRAEKERALEGHLSEQRRLLQQQNSLEERASMRLLAKLDSERRRNHVEKVEALLREEAVKVAAVAGAVEVGDDNAGHAGEGGASVGDRQVGWPAKVLGNVLNHAAQGDGVPLGHSLLSLIRLVRLCMCSEWIRCGIAHCIPLEMGCRILHVPHRPAAPAGTLQQMQDAALKQLTVARKVQLEQLQTALSDPPPHKPPCPAASSTSEDTPDLSAQLAAHNAAEDELAAERDRLCQAATEQHSESGAQLEEPQVASPWSLLRAEGSGLCGELGGGIHGEVLSALHAEGVRSLEASPSSTSRASAPLQSRAQISHTPQQERLRSSKARQMPERELLREELASVRTMIEGLHSLRRAVQAGETVHVCPCPLCMYSPAWPLRVACRDHLCSGYR
jgi:hypothetical protein